MVSSKHKVNLDPKVNPEREDILITVDSTGITVTNREEWIIDKWKKKRIRKGFIKIHIAVVNIKKENSINGSNKRKCS
jgi:hypothetical protein